MFKRNNFNPYQNPNMMYNNFEPNNSPQTPMFDQQGQMYPNIQYERLVYEIKENRRRINNLAKRIVRMENYLRIKDTSDTPIEDDLHNPGNYSF